MEISIVIPVYNAEKYLKECIDSCLNQTFNDFELILVNDGSTDNSEEIILSYDDSRIRYFSEVHRGVAETRNTGVYNAIGKYIIYMDSDDVMLPNRLEIQYTYMEQHPHIDILGAGARYLGGQFIPKETILSFDDFKIGSVIFAPTVIMRRESIIKLPFLLQSYFNAAVDYKFWITAITHGLVVANMSEIVLKYRVHSNQLSQTPTCALNSKRIQHLYYGDHSKSKNLTVIIAFKNEECEIERTVESIRATTTGVNIMLINDCSDRKFDYESIARFYNCIYLENDISLGSSQSKNLGAMNCPTDYFVLLDGHMRFYEDGWDDKIIDYLSHNPNTLLTSNTSIIKKEVNTYINEDGVNPPTKSCGAYVEDYEAKWSYHYQDIDEMEIPCVLGAFYACSTAFWKKIGGLNGLHHYGIEEPLMSIKTWLAGGRVIIFPNFYVGHLYRDKFPYKVDDVNTIHNKLYLIYLFEENPQDMVEKLKKKSNIDVFNKAMQLLDLDSLNKFKKDFFTNVACRDMQFYNELNSKFK